MQKILVVVDMQNDFIDGSLGTKEAVSIVPNVIDKISNFNGLVLYTRDTHYDNYLSTQEGKNLPVVHCIKGSDGWQIQKDIDVLRTCDAFDKPSFGSVELGHYLAKLNSENPIEEICFIGLCTDICVISNAMIAKAVLPEVPISVDASCCAGVTPESHLNALNAMSMCQIRIDNK